MQAKMPTKPWEKGDDAGRKQRKQTPEIGERGHLLMAPLSPISGKLWNERDGVGHLGSKAGTDFGLNLKITRCFLSGQNRCQRCRIFLAHGDFILVDGKDIVD